MERLRHRARRAAPWRDERRGRIDDARAWAPSRPGARRLRRRVTHRYCRPAIWSARPGARGSTSISATTRSKPSICGAASYLDAAHALYGIDHLAALCRLLAGARPASSRCSTCSTDASDAGATARRGGARIARFELRLLAELGFGLDLATCAATGADHPSRLCVAEKRASGLARGRRAVARRLLALPAFLAAAIPASRRPQSLRDGFALTGFFLARYVFEPRGEPLPDVRPHFIAAIERSAKEVA